MSSRPLRFVQAGDFELHQPLYGLMEVPEHLAERLIEAPYQAAERVFDAALAADVDFLLLTGDLCDPHRAGPRGLVFLRRQFGRLAERGIAIYWATSPADGCREWPAQLEWSSGVHVFASNRVEHLTHHRDGTPVCQIAGRSVDEATAAAQFPAAALAPSPDGLFSIAIVPGSLPFEADDLAAIGNNYWAFGGSPRAATTLAEFDPPCVVHCAGTPQPRTSCRGPHALSLYGCTLVHADGNANGNASASDQHQIHLSPIAADVVRWHEERIVCSEPFVAADLERQLHERMQGLIAAGAGRTLLIRWHIDGSHAVAAGFNQSGLSVELLSTLRTEYGFREAPAWTVSLTMMPPELPALWSEQQTLLGEFLRRLEDLESASAEQPKLDCLLSPRHLARPLAERMSLVDPTSRASVLRQAAILGAELLSSGAAIRETAAHDVSPRAKGATSR